MASKTSPSCEDQRGKKIVFVSSCLLDQNRRFPGIAVESGAITPLITGLLNQGIGIEQLPCLECLGWGGVSRRSLFRFLPTLYNRAGSKIYPILKFIAKIWLGRFQRLCQKEAKNIGGQIEDLQKSGYNLLAVIAMNDSPTCGATQTMHLLESIEKYKALGLSLEDLMHPRLEQMKAVMPQILEEGSGYFMGALKTVFEQMKLNIPVIGFDPWQDLNSETQRIVQRLQV